MWVTTPWIKHKVSSSEKCSCCFLKSWWRNRICCTVTKGYCNLVFQSPVYEYYHHPLIMQNCETNIKRQCHNPITQVIIWLYAPTTMTAVCLDSDPKSIYLSIVKQRHLCDSFGKRKVRKDESPKAFNPPSLQFDFSWSNGNFCMLWRLAGKVCWTSAVICFLLVIELDKTSISSTCLFIPLIEGRSSLIWWCIYNHHIWSEIVIRVVVKVVFSSAFEYCMQTFLGGIL